MKKRYKITFIDGTEGFLTVEDDGLEAALGTLPLEWVTIEEWASDHPAYDRFSFE